MILSKLIIILYFLLFFLIFVLCRRAITDAFGDYHLVCPTILFGQQMAISMPHQKYYSYRLTHQSTYGCRGWKGVCHGEDIRYVFGIPGRFPSHNSNDYHLSIDMMKAWTMFAKYGQPGNMGHIQWEKALSKSATTEFMALEPNHYQMVDQFYKPVCEAFWKEKIFA